MLHEARHVVVFTGAGMSTESGLPDFRSTGGLWKQNQRFEELASVRALVQQYSEFVEFYRWRIRMLRSFRPNVGHEILARWQRRGLIHRVVTQNVDGFHEQAESADILALHGTLRRVHCEHCGHSRSSETFLEPDGTQCGLCKGTMRPSVVLFGESLDAETLQASFDEATSADLLLVLGSLSRRQTRSPRRRRAGEPILPLSIASPRRCRSCSAWTCGPRSGLRCRRWIESLVDGHGG